VAAETSAKNLGDYSMILFALFPSWRAANRFNATLPRVRFAAHERRNSSPFGSLM